MAANLDISIHLNVGRGKRKRSHDEVSADADLTEMNSKDEMPAGAIFRKSVFYAIIDNVIRELTHRFQAARSICTDFSFLWLYKSLSADEITKMATTFATKYLLDVSQEVVEEVIYLKTIHCANIGKEQLKPLDLLNQITNMKLDQIFPNTCVALRILLTIPASVASAERSFSKLKLIKNHLRSTMS